MFDHQPLAGMQARQISEQATDLACTNVAGSWSGTGLALKNKISSGASDCKPNWGGRRNSASRTSSSLSFKQASDIIAAAKFAWAIGLPFNRFLTIHWEQAGIPDSQAAWATGRFLKLAGDWITKRGGRIAWVWVRENGDAKGSHVHILLHVPAVKITGSNGHGRPPDNTLRKQRKGLGNMPRRWLGLITGFSYVASTIETKRIGGTAGAALTAPAAYEANLATVVGYALKGACEAAIQSLRLELQEPGGTIVAKRSAASQNIGSAARKRASQAQHGIRGCVTEASRNENNSGTKPLVVL